MANYLLVNNNTIVLYAYRICWLRKIVSTTKKNLIISDVKNRLEIAIILLMFNQIVSISQTILVD